MNLIDQVRDNRDQYRSEAERALAAVQKDIEYVLYKLGENPPVVEETVLGTILNWKEFQDAERALTRFADAAKVVAVLEGTEVPGQVLATGGPVEWDAEDRERDDDAKANEELADRFFEDQEPGSVSEDEYQAKVREIRDARNYLRYEPCWRVELNRVPTGPFTSRIQWVEAMSEEEAVDAFDDPKDRKRRGKIYAISVRRATEEDIEEFLEVEDRMNL